MVYAIDATTGRIRWEREAHKGPPVGGRHRKNTYASETPVTDGERVYVYFGNVGLFAYALDGTPLWSKRFEPQPMYLDFGTASSPVVHGGLVFILHDNDGKSFVAAVDARTGQERWRINRDLPSGRLSSGWSTPFVWKHERGAELVIVGRQHAVGYSLEGKQLWQLRGLTGQSTPTPGGRRRAAVCRDRITGRVQPSRVRGEARRDGRCLAGRRGRAERVRRLDAPARVRATPRLRSSIAGGCMW